MAANILLVEDDASVREAVGGVLRDEGYVVQTADDGQQAIRAHGGKSAVDH